MSLFEPKYRYTFNNRSSRDYSRLRAAVRDGGKRLPDGPHLQYRCNIAGENIGVLGSLREAQGKARRRLKNRPAGTDVRIEAVRGNKAVEQVRFRKTKNAPDPKPTPGNEYLDRVEGFIEDFFPRARWAGDCVCKPDSDHRYCRAVDYFDSYENMDRMRRMLLENAQYFGIKYIILRDRIYYANGTSSYYGGVYHTHIHISVNGPSRDCC